MHSMLTSRLVLEIRQELNRNQLSNPKLTVIENELSSNIVFSSNEERS